MSAHPGSAAALSVLWPGLGQIYAGRVARGFVVMSLQSVLLLGYVMATTALPGDPAPLLGFLLGGTVVHWAQIFDAYHVAREDGARPARRRLPRSGRNKWRGP